MHSRIVVSVRGNNKTFMHADVMLLSRARIRQNLGNPLQSEI